MKDFCLYFLSTFANDFCVVLTQWVKIKFSSLSCDTCMAIQIAAGKVRGSYNVIDQKALEIIWCNWMIFFE